MNKNKNVKSIIHHLSVPGPSFLPNDHDFGDTEKSKSKKDAIYTVCQYEQLIKSSKKEIIKCKTDGNPRLFQFHERHQF